MIEKELFELLRQQYSPVISNIINSDVRFYRTKQTIQWRFGYDERVAIFACCDKKTNIVTVNIAAVDFSFQQNEPFNEEDYCQAIEALQLAMERYDPSTIGYAWDKTNPRIQLEPRGERGYIELRAVR